MPVLATYFSVRRGRDPFFKFFMRTLFPKQVHEYEEKFGNAVKAADAATLAATLATPHPHEGARKYFPTIGDHVVFLMTSHEMDHLGQLAAWRRAMGLGPGLLG